MTGRTEFTAVSTNPAIDRVALVDGPVGGVVRATKFLETPGGKAIHAACVASELGARSSVIATAGGTAGELLVRLLNSEPVNARPVAVAGTTRGTYTLVGSGKGDLVEIHEPASPLTQQECDRLVAELTSAEPNGDVIAICGSLPSGSPPGLHARLVEASRDLGAFTILDCSTPEALSAGIEAGPDLVAPNLAEATRLLGGDLTEASPEADLIELATAIRSRGAKAVWLTLGEKGSLLADGDDVLRLTAPVPGTLVNAVGCGDALIGGLAAGLIQGRRLDQAAVLGVAAAANKLGHLHPGRVSRADVEAIADRIEVSRLGVHSVPVKVRQ